MKNLHFLVLESIQAYAIHSIIRKVLDLLQIFFYTEENHLFLNLDINIKIKIV